MASDTNEANNLSNSMELKTARDDERSEIVDFYDGANVLVTGGTGFVGKVLVEKLLRSCPGIATLYMIVRPKRGKSAEVRFKENFDEVVYDRLKQERPDFKDKIVMIESNIAEGDFSFTQEINEMLMKTNVVFHAAATVRFDEKLRLAVNTNVRFTKCILQWAKGLPNLKAFVHVSTAFSNCPNKIIEEIHYKSTIDPDDLISLANSLDDDQLEAMKPILFSKFPNNYIITKAIAEVAVLKYGQDIPAGIVRPSIVLPTSEEPLKAWINNSYGSTGLIVGAGLGFLRTLHCIPEYVADIVPADYVVATVIAASWDIANRKSVTKLEEDANLLPDEEKVPVYNSISSAQNPITWREYSELNKVYGLHIPSMNSIWYFMFFFTRYAFMYRIYIFLLHTIPAFIADMIACLIGRKPTLMNTYKKVHKFAGVMHYFTTHQWEFRNENVRKMWGKLNSVDRKMFNFNIENIIWTDYFYHHIRGVRQYLVNDPLETLDAAITKYNRYRLWILSSMHLRHCNPLNIILIFPDDFAKKITARLRIAHYTVVMIITLLVAWLTLSIVTSLWPHCPWSY